MVNWVWPWLKLCRQLPLYLSSVIREEQGSNVLNGALESEQDARRSDWLSTQSGGYSGSLAPTKDVDRQEEESKKKKNELELKRRIFFDTLWFTLRCAWIQQHRKAAACKQNWAQQRKYGSECSGAVVPSAMSETSQDLRVRATACSRRTPPTWGLHQLFMQKQRKRDTTGLTSASSSGGCDSLQSEFNRFFTAANEPKFDRPSSLGATWLQSKAQPNNKTHVTLAWML